MGRRLRWFAFKCLECGADGLLSLGLDDGGSTPEPEEMQECLECGGNNWQRDYEAEAEQGLD